MHNKINKMDTVQKNIIITFGTYDMLHIGHINILTHAAQMKGPEGQLIVGISSDALNVCKKQRHAIFNQDDRVHIVSHVKGVDTVFLEESLELKRKYILEHNANILLMGDDWTGRFDEFGDICKVIYVPRTKNISTSLTIQNIKTT